MSGTVRLVGEETERLTQLGQSLRAAGWALRADASDEAATILVTWTADAELAMAAATRFAAVTAPEGLVVHLWQAGAPDWQAKCHAATMEALTRHTALQWAERRVRVNGVAGSAAVTADDLAATILALSRWPSMTGQVITLSTPPV